MNKIWEFYENMNEIVYVADMDTYEIIYINRLIRDMFNVDSVEEVKGKTCYELFQGCASPCAICNNIELKPGQFKEWKYYNPAQHKTYMIKDTIIQEGDKKYRMEIAIDVTLQEQQKQIIKNYMDSEMMINEALQISLSSYDPDESINRLLDYLGKSLESDRVYIFEINENETYDNTYEWCAQGVQSKKDRLQDISPEVVETWMPAFKKNKGIAIKELELIKDTEPKIYDVLRDKGVTSLVTNPIFDGDRLVGFYGVDNPPSEILNSISSFFEILAKFCTSILKRRNLVRQLRILSFSDQMTGCGNRRGLEFYMKDFTTHSSIGVIYADLTGLKHINDVEGHGAGDNKLIESVSCLRKQFDLQQIFRVGGDEFIVICKEIAEEEFENKINNLKKDIRDTSVPLAIGYVWDNDYDGDIDKLLSCADRLMYEDKEKQHEYIRRCGYNKAQI